MKRALLMMWLLAAPAVAAADVAPGPGQCVDYNDGGCSCDTSKVCGPRLDMSIPRDLAPRIGSDSRLTGTAEDRLVHLLRGGAGPAEGLHGRLGAQDRRVQGCQGPTKLADGGADRSLQIDGNHACSPGKLFRT